MFFQPPTLTGRLLRYVLAFFVGMASVGLVSDLFIPKSDYLTNQGRPVAMKPRETSLSERMSEETKPCVPVVTKKPTPKQKKKVERKFDLDLEDVDLLAINKIPRLPDGGEEAITRNRATGKVETTILPNKRKLFDFGGKLEFGAGLAFSATDGIGYIGFIEKDFARVGRYKSVFVRGRIEGEYFPESSLDKGDVRANLNLVYRGHD